MTHCHSLGSGCKKVYEQVIPCGLNRLLMCECRCESLNVFYSDGWLLMCVTADDCVNRR